jgi:AcrR family transcriptional regulator
MAAKAKASSNRTVVNGLTPARRRPEHASSGAGPVGRDHVIEIQRARILAAMFEVCAERGTANVTVGHVVERAGVSRRTFYELFSDREACFLGAFDEAVARASSYVLDGYDPGAGWAERLRIALTGLLSFLDVERGAGQLLIVGSLGAGASALERRRCVLAQMISLVDEGHMEMKAGVELPPLTAEGIVGGVLSVLHARLLAPGDEGLDFEGDSLVALIGPLMSMVVLPFLGPVAARRELVRPISARPVLRVPVPADPLRDVHMRLTYRTVRVLIAVAALAGRGSYPSNREIGLAAEISDQGQISKLLTRLSGLGLIENTDAGLARGAPNAWTLTPKGHEIQQAIGEGVAG